MQQKNLAVVLATYNEEKNLERCLRSIINIASEIIIVDGNSQDGTKQIAAKYTKKIIDTDNLPMFHTNKQMAIDKATKKWILQLDADEVVNEQLQQEIISAIMQPDIYTAYSLPRKNIFFGKWLKKGGLYPDRMVRLFLKGKAHFPQKSVHEQIEVNGKIGELNNPLIHYTAPNLSRYLENANRYTSLTAKQLFESGVKLNFISFVNFIILKPTKTFLSIFIRHRGYEDGFYGWLFALLSSLHWSLAYFKLYELNLRGK
jgi:glycosyltransferase involved in cell wall biosynthesis